MGFIIFQISVVTILVLFLGFLAYDDRRNRKIREEESLVKPEHEDRDER
ncbi:MAG: hypothetical protein ACE5EH_04385 [Gammaproteobacteria bacterium]